MSIKVSGTSTHRRWHRAIAGAQADVLVFSPYLTSRTAEWVVGAGKALTVYTCFNIEAFIAGASSLDTLARLLRRGVKLFHLPDLHAKVVTDRRTILFIGSQNLTRRGTKNKEATLWTNDSAALGDFDRLFGSWIAERVCITKEMIDDARRLIRPLKKAALALAAAAEVVQQQVEAGEQERQERLRKQHQQAHAEYERQEVERYRRNMRWRLEALGEDVTPLELARQIVRSAIWWTSHSSGRPVRARGHAERISERDPGRRLELGSNYFAVGKFVQKAKAALWRYFDSLDEWGWLSFHQEGELLPWKLDEELRGDVSSSVEHANGTEYHQYPVGADGYMRFGTQAVSVSECVRVMLDAVRLRPR